MGKNMCEANKPALTVAVETSFLAQQSKPEQGQYLFSYRMTITNHGDEDVRLLQRHWWITDGLNRTQEVRGRGVVGEQPLISAGSAYEYTSGVLLDTPVGSMKGHYQMQLSSGERVEVLIPEFVLSVPGALH